LLHIGTITDTPHTVLCWADIHWEI